MRSKGQTAVIEANRKGYIVDEDGNVFRNGKQRTISNDGKGYLRFSIRTENREHLNVSVHRLQAYQKYGESSFDKGIEVRHKNGIKTDNSYENILKGTRSDNQQDIPKEVRVARSSCSRSLFTDEQVLLILKDRQEGMSYNKLADKYKTAKTNIAYLLTGALYAKRLNIRS